MRHHLESKPNGRDEPDKIIANIIRLKQTGTGRIGWPAEPLEAGHDEAK